MIAGGVADFSVFAPHEQRLSNLVESFSELNNPITEYLQAKPEDGAAEGRFKNALEGLLLGAIAEPFVQSLRLLKYARIKWSAVGVKTKQRYQLEAKKTDVDTVSLDFLKNINIGQQGKHIPQHNNYIPGRSTINNDINAQSLLDGVHSGQYKIIGKGSRGQPIVDFGKPIGTDAASGMNTQYGTIHSGKNGVHIVPTNPTIIKGK